MKLSIDSEYDGIKRLELIHDVVKLLCNFQAPGREQGFDLGRKKPVWKSFVMLLPWLASCSVMLIVVLLLLLGFEQEEKV